MLPIISFRPALVSPARRSLALLALTLLLPALSRAADFYVAATGNDGNAGSLAAPFATLMRAQTAASAGDTIYVRGGTYTTFTVTASDSAYNYVHRFSKSGIHWSAYPGEIPLFDFSSVPTTLRVCGFHVTGNGLKVTGFYVTGVKDGAQKQSECWRIDGASAYVDFYDCVAYNNAANGFYWTTNARGSATRCDAYNNLGTNADSVGNTDGFGAHGDGVVFRYCRSWNNSDDGYDCISSSGANTFDHCWSFNNRGGGNKAGFKVGGFGADPNTVPPSPVPVHTVTYCVSAFNGAQGFYANHQPGQAANWTKNTAFNNSAGNYNMLERFSDMSADVAGYREVLHYNLAFTGTTIVSDNNPPENVTDNSWTKPGITVNAADFLNTDWTQLSAPRSAGNNMPFISFMHLAPGSDLAGLGAFDPPPAAPTGVVATWASAGNVALTWTASPGATTYYVKRATTVGGPYTTVAARLTGTSYTDAAATGATSYYYVVSAMDDLSFDESAHSAEATAIQGPIATILGVGPDTGRSVTDGVTSAAGLTILGTAGNTTGAAGANSLVNVYRAGLGLVGSTTANSSGAWSFDYTTTTLPEGPQTFTAIAVNNGHTGVESPVYEITVDGSAPPAPVIAAAIGSPLVFTGSAEPQAIVTITRAGEGVVGMTLADGAGEWTCLSSTSLSSGTASFTATATDLAGNGSPASLALLFDSSIAAPQITALAPDNGVAGSDLLTNVPGIIFSGTSTPGAEIHVLRRGFGPIGTALANSGGTWSLDYSGTLLSDGTHIFNAIAMAGGSSSLYSADFAVVIDTLAPEVTSVVRQSPAFATITGSVTAVTYRVSFSKPVYNVVPVRFTVSTTGDAAGSVTGVTPVSSSVYDVTVGGLSGAGELRVEPVAGIIDAAGNGVVSGFPAGQAYTRAAVSLGSGIWTRPATAGLWSDETNWQDLVIADGAAHSANFSTLNLTASNTVRLDSPRTLNSLSFGDVVAATAASWVVDDGGNAANTLTLAGPSPAISVGPLGTGATTTLNAALAGSGGLTKTGAGILVLGKANPLTGGLNLAAGTLRLAAGGALALDANAALGGLSTLNVTGGSFATTGTAAMTNSNLVIASGLATIDGGVTLTSNKDGIIQVTGGTLTTPQIDIFRSTDGTINYAFGLIVSGGTVNLDSLKLGSVNSNGLASIEGGVLNVAGMVTMGSQSVSGRGAALRVTNGTFNVEDTTFGLLMSKVYSNGTTTNINNVVQANFLGGVSTLGRITLGYDETVTAGSGTVTINAGTLYLGSGGIVKNGGSGMTTTITFTAGTLGASADWSTTHPIVFSGTGAKTVRAANVAGAPFDIALDGVLSSTGPLTKTGGGTLTLGGANTRTGVTTINEGVLAVATIANGGTASNLGQAALAATNLVINGGTLRYTGAAASHNRLFTLGANGATLDASGTGALAFNSTTALTVAGTGNRTLTLTGENTANNTLATPIPNPSSGTTSVTKGGAGTWMLSGSNTFTGNVGVGGGILSVTGSLAAGGTATVDNGGTLAGTGTVNKAMVLNAGGAIAPAGAATGTLSGASLTWNGGGRIEAALGGTSDRLTLTGALTKGAAGSYEFIFSGTPAVGSVHTVASFGSTTFVAADFSASGVTGSFAITGNNLLFTVAAPPDAAFNAWAGSLPAGLRGAADDADGDGLTNLFEFTTGQDGNAVNAEGSLVSVVSDGGQDYPAITYTRRIDRGGVTVNVLVSTNLDFSASLGAIELSATPAVPGFETVVVRSTVSLTVQPRQFFRLTATLP